jgi:hypothetical protein
MSSTDDLRLVRLAEVGAVVGATGLVTLGLMFAIEVPRGGPYLFGTINDLTGTAFNVLLIPVAIRVARDASATPALRLATAGALVAAAAGAVLPLLLVGGVMSFETQAPLVVACIEVQSLWLIALGRGLRGVPGRRRLSRLSQLVGASFIGGSVLFGAGFLAPEGSILRTLVWAGGGIVGALGYLGWPYWFHAVGRTLDRQAHHAESKELAWTRS